MKVKIFSLLSITILIAVRLNSLLAENEILICHYHAGVHSWNVSQDTLTTTVIDGERCCAIGIWILYTEPVYLGDTFINNQSLSNSSTSPNCFDLPEGIKNKIHSVRYAGIIGKPFESFIVIFQNTEFRGVKYVIEKFEAQLVLEGSMIIGCGNWSLYDESNTRGNCQYFESPVKSKCVPTTFKNMSKEMTGIQLKSIKSVLKAPTCTKTTTIATATSTSNSTST